MNILSVKKRKAETFCLSAEMVILCSVILLSAVSCRKNEQSDYKNFVSSELVFSYKTSYINILLSTAAVSYPGIDAFNNYISDDVDVYKLIYKTEVGGKKINASGLVCVPAGGGEHPVICFQNGTNTLNSNAPTQYVINPVYQFIEVVASMGFIVVIPDYPGFGESSDIPHPYLVKEPTVKSITDMLRAVNEPGATEFSGVTVKNEYYLMGYSQGGWATLSLHKDMEADNPGEFNLKGSVCGAGPYNMSLLFDGITNLTTYPMPVFLGYIINAYSKYNQFTNPVTDIINEPYASKLSTLYNGTLNSDQINSQLTTSISGLFNADFIASYRTSAKYLSVQNALTNNSVTGWKTTVPLYLIHGGGDKTVNPSSTENIYNSMIQAGTSADICKKEILPGLDHGDAIIPAMVKGLAFIINLNKN